MILDNFSDWGWLGTLAILAAVYVLVWLPRQERRLAALEAAKQRHPGYTAPRSLR